MKTKQLFTLQEAQAPEMERLNPVLLKGVITAHQAAKLSVSFAGTTYEAVASEMGKQKENVTRFVNNNGGLKPNDIEAFINATGNVFFLQYLCNRFGYELVSIDTKEKRRAELLAELQQLESAA